MTFEQLLSRLGLERQDLATDAGMDFLGHAPARTVPWVLPHVEEVREDPLRLMVLGNNLTAVAAKGELLPLITASTLQPLHPARFRGFPPPGGGVPGSPGALTAVLERLRAPGRPAGPLGRIVHPEPVVGSPLPAPGAEELALPEPLRAPLARLLAAVVVAAEGVERSWRQVPPQWLEAALSAPEVPRLLPGGAVAWPALERVAREAGSGPDAAARGVAFLRLAGSLEEEAAHLAEVASAGLVPSGFDRWQAETPRGRIVVAGVGDHRHRCRHDCLLVVDLGGDESWQGTVGGARMPTQPVSVALDLGGEDRYTASLAGASGSPDGDGPGSPGLPAQGAGRGGVGILVDLGGDDLYRASDGAQGFSLLGHGLLWDAAGRDRYQAGGGAQGAAIFGGALLFDSGSEGDEYRILGEGQGFGGPGGAGALVDSAGDDRYYAEPDPSVALGRGDYHSDDRVAANNAQGAGVGRRGDLSDGLAWAGGVGTLLDLAGGDSYFAGNFSQGMGYQWGTGLLLDREGDDSYRSVYFSQGSSLHGGMALLWDGAGRDRHLLEREAAASLGYGWDRGVTLFVDGGGDDSYQGKNTILGVAERSSVALFVELAGRDEYRVPPPDGDGVRTLGAVDGNPGGYRQEGEGTGGGPPALRAAAFSNSVGLFLDLAGRDGYPESDRPEPGGPGEDRPWRWSGEPEGLGVGKVCGAGWDGDLGIAGDAVPWLLGFGAGEQ